MVGRSPLIKLIINKGSVARNVISGMSPTQQEPQRDAGPEEPAERCVPTPTRDPVCALIWVSPFPSLGPNIGAENFCIVQRVCLISWPYLRLV